MGSRALSLHFLLPSSSEIRRRAEGYCEFSFVDHDQRLSVPAHRRPSNVRPPTLVQVRIFQRESCVIVLVVFVSS